MGVKNLQNSFLQRGSKATSPMSQDFIACKKHLEEQIYFEIHHLLCKVPPDLPLDCLLVALPEYSGG
jgi:hypothetical protein